VRVFLRGHEAMRNGEILVEAGSGTETATGQV
jgi:hypothetical protein